MMNRITKFSKNAYRTVMRSVSNQITSPTYKLAELENIREQVRKSHPADLALLGYKVYSQNDEDGIIAAIFDKIGTGSTFLEIGVENGTECNTHFLALKDWRGAWIEGSDEKCIEIETNLGGRTFPGRFKVIEAMVDRGNISALYNEVTAFCGVNDLDFFPLDIDGNDLFVLDTLLDSGARPAVICIEYNGKFPPPLAITVAYDAQRNWQHDDHFGASLQAFCNALTQYRYKLVTCNLIGANAFFVHEDLGHFFDDVTPAQVWRVLRLDLGPLPAGHRPSLGWLREAVNRPAGG